MRTMFEIALAEGEAILADTADEARRVAIVEMLAQACGSFERAEDAYDSLSRGDRIVVWRALELCGYRLTRIRHDGIVAAAPTSPPPPKPRR